MPVADTQTVPEGAAGVAEEAPVEVPKEASQEEIDRVLARVSSECERTVLQGCEEFSWLALEVRNRGALLAAGAVDIALTAMQSWMGKRCAVLRGLMGALRHLLCFPGAVDAFYAFENDLLRRHSQDTGYRGGGTLLVEAAMSGYPLKTDIQVDGCILARSLAQADPDRFVRHGMVGYVLAAMHRHPECARLAQKGCGCISVAAATEDLCRWMVNEGVVVEYVAHALEEHTGNSAVVRAAVEALLRLQSVEELQEKVRRGANSVPPALAALETHYLNEEVALLLIQFIEPHIAHFPSRLDEAAAAVRKVMSRHAEPAVLVACCTLIAQIGENAPDDATKARVARSTVPFMAAALQTFADNEAVTAAANRGLASLVVNKWATGMGHPRRSSGSNSRPARFADPVPRRPAGDAAAAAAGEAPEGGGGAAAAGRDGAAPSDRSPLLSATAPASGS